MAKDKDLLLKYLCMALPYGVKVYCGEDWAMTLKQIDYKCFCECWENEDLKCNSRWMLPYLRSMSSMTEEEEEEWADLFNKPIIELDKYSDKDAEEIAPQMFAMSHTSSIIWLLEHYFDFMGLIPKGLAIEVTESNNPYESNM